MTALRRFGTRRLAARVLLAWLLVLGSGLVQACVLMPLALGAAAQAAEAAPPCHGDAGDASDAAAVVADAQCQKRCSDGANLLPVPPQAADPGPALALSLPTPPQLPALVLAAAPAPHAQAPPGPGPVPIPIAFLRLAR